MIGRRPWMMGLGARLLTLGAGGAAVADAAQAGVRAAADAASKGAAPAAADAAAQAAAQTASRAASHDADAFRRTAAKPSSPASALSRAPLVFPRDHGSHPETRVEWWYVTGVLRPDGTGAGRNRSASDKTTTSTGRSTDEQAPAPAAGPATSGASADGSILAETPAYGFQLTFFRVRRELDRPLDSRFAPSQIMLAHVAVTDLTRRRMHHDQHLLRQGFANAFTDETDTRVRLGDWSLVRSAGPQGLSRYRLAFRSQPANVALSLTLDAPLPPLLQGHEGWSQKGPQPEQASRYVSEPQLSGQGQLAVDGLAPQNVQAQCWLDHEWSQAYLGTGSDDSTSRAVGWDWLGLNMLDGSAVMLFQMRRRDGSTLWTGGTWRSATGAQQNLEGQLQFEPQAHWRSPTSLSRYPVQWRVRTPKGLLRIEAMFDAQEVDARRTTGFLYWEGVVRVLDDAGTLRGWGYLEMTGYAGRVPL